MPFLRLSEINRLTFSRKVYVPQKDFWGKDSREGIFKFCQFLKEKEWEGGREWRGCLLSIKIVGRSGVGGGWFPGSFRERVCVCVVVCLSPTTSERILEMNNCT